jgi:hypothetical protein
MNRRKTTKESSNLYGEESIESRVYKRNVHLTDGSGNGKYETECSRGGEDSLRWSALTPCSLIGTNVSQFTLKLEAIYYFETLVKYSSTTLHSGII